MLSSRVRISPLVFVATMLLLAIPPDGLRAGTATEAPDTSAVQDASRGGSASKAIYCPDCGTRNRSGSRFCKHDGAALPQIDPALFRLDLRRPSETFSPEEFQQMIQKASASVVRIRALPRGVVRFPVVERSRRPGRSIGSLVEVEAEQGISGSGFVISAGGEVVTNAHVASPMGLEARLTVESRDGRTFPANVIGLDRASDLALLKIGTGSIPALAWSDERQLHLGEDTWAIGNPLNTGLSVTRGTISTIGRVRMGFNQIENYIHSDAFITHGSSGGPLIDVWGDVVGVSAVGFHKVKGQGYSIPATMARFVIDRLRRDGAYRRGFIGAHVTPIDGQSVKTFDLKRSSGLVVRSVLHDSPAARAGIEPGDVIFGINGRQTTNSYYLQEAISSLGPNVVVNVVFDRQGRIVEMAVRTEERPAAPRIDPVRDLEEHLMIRLVEEPDKNRIVIRIDNRFSIAPLYGLADGNFFREVIPAGDWRVAGGKEIVRRNLPGSAAPANTPVASLDDLRRALRRSYVGGRLGVALLIETDRKRAAYVAFDETWHIII